MAAGGPEARCVAVLARGARKSYGDVSVLEGLDMTVLRGTVYGLLGASGCGKTTLLSCVVGRRQLDSGEVRVLGFKPGSKGSGVPGRRIGYMPQEVALYSNFTVRQTMRYFGCIFNMRPEDVQRTTDELLDMLDLPYPDRLVKTLSGGQMRRVSFAAALLHDPEVLVLDEPTVGMDPVLRDVIWRHLLQITSSGRRTIILTTHYIEEARQAHRIGLMRSGRLLDEDSADALMAKYRCESLEDVFLHLSVRQEQAAAAPEVLSDLNPSAQDVQEEDYKTTSEEFPMVEEINENRLFGVIGKSSMKALLFKNTISIFRDPSYLAFTFGLCVLAVSCVFMGVGYEPRALTLAVVNHDADARDPRCSGPLRAGSCHRDLGCRFLERLRPSVVLQEFHDSRESAAEAVRRGSAWGSLYFSENFTSEVAARLLVDSWLSGRPVPGAGDIQVQMDMSDQVISLIVQRELLTTYMEFVRSQMVACNISEKLANIPINIKPPIYGTESPTFLNYAAPGTLALMMFFFGVALSVWSITYERLDGLINRNIVAGITSFEIMLSYLVTQFLLMCGQAALIVFFGIFVYHFECQGSIWLAILLLLVQGVSGMSYGFLVSALFEEEITVAIVSLGSLLPMLFLCGVCWPLEGMPAVMKLFSEFVPLTLPVKGLRAIMARGWTLAHFEVYVSFLSSSAWIAVLFALCVVALRFKKL
ncbi:ABC transporter G family member 20-like isoform X2 [Bacillus rossius redtenbacheri]